jgi:hypothetical protein
MFDFNELGPEYLFKDVHVLINIITKIKEPRFRGAPYFLGISRLKAVKA